MMARRHGMPWAILEPLERLLWVSWNRSTEGALQRYCVNVADARSPKSICVPTEHGAQTASGISAKTRRVAAALRSRVRSAH